MGFETAKGGRNKEISLPGPGTGSSGDRDGVGRGFKARESVLRGGVGDDLVA